MPKRLLIGMLTASALVGPALGADLAPKVAPAPALSWSGFYAGVNVGGSWGGGSSGITAVPTFYLSGPGYPGAPGFAATAAQGATGERPSESRSGFIGGAQIGYNFQRNSLVGGVEADLQGLTNNHATSTTVSSVALPAPLFSSNLITTTTTSRSLDYLGTVRARLGFLVDRNLLLYVAGGLAYGGVASSASISNFRDTGFQTPGFSSGNFSGTRVGYTLGGGAEWMWRNRWSIKTEYLYYDLGTASYALSPLSNNLVQGGTLYTTVAPTVSTRFDGHIARAGINYHF